MLRYFGLVRLSEFIRANRSLAGCIQLQASRSKHNITMRGCRVFLRQPLICLSAADGANGALCNGARGLLCYGANEALCYGNNDSYGVMPII